MNGEHDHESNHDHAGHEHQTPGSPLEPAVDARTGKLEPHCSSCGASLLPGEDFCRVCALEADGGESPLDDENEAGE